MKKILIVDDDRDILNLLAAFLRLARFKVLQAENGKIGIKLAISEKPDLILLDIMMPQMDGFEVLNEIRSNTELVSTPVIMLTALNERKTVEKALIFGANDFIVKPPDRELLLERVREWSYRKAKPGWGQLSPKQRNVLRLTVLTMNKAFDCVYRGEQLPYVEIQKMASILVEVVEHEDVSGVLDILQNHDNYTYGHAIRSAFYITLLGKSEDMGDLQTLATGGLIHDIGKAQIPLSILNKPAPFNNEEFEIMKKHVIFSKKILRENGVSPAVIEIGGDHHEKIDGSGYPCGLKGKQISQYARMAAIVDAYDALISKRAYKLGFPPSQALDMLTNPPGHLDQQLVWRFKRVVEAYL